MVPPPCHAWPRECWDPHPTSPGGAQATPTPPRHAAPSPGHCPAPSASCLHLSGGSRVGPHHAETPLSGDKSPLLANPFACSPPGCAHTHTRAHTHTHTHIKCIFVLFDGKGIFSHRLAVPIETPESGVGHPPAAGSTRSTCACGCARPCVPAGHGQRPPGAGCRHGGIAACPLRQFHVYNGRRRSQGPKSLQFYCFHGNPDTWRGARILLQPSEARGRGEKKPGVCVNERGRDGSARVRRQQHP